MIKPLSELAGLIYSQALKPIYFASDPELVHDAHVAAGQALAQTPLKHLLSTCFAYSDPKLTKVIDGITFPNSIGLSAGFDYTAALTELTPHIGFGWHTIGTITLEPYEGNHRPRLGRFPNSKALLVNKGLKNDGVEEVIRKLSRVTFHIPVGISIASTNKAFKTTKEQVDDILQCFKALEAATLNHMYYELNISCPNTFGGEPFTTPKRLDALLKSIDELKLYRPLYIKMPIDQSQSATLKLLKVCDKHSVAGVIFGNLTKDHDNPTVTPEDRKRWRKSPGNLSGKPTWERSNACIALTKKHYPKRFTIIGTGGIFNGGDAAKKLELGADLVQLITGMIYRGPQLIGQMNHYLAHHTLNPSSK